MKRIFAFFILQQIHMIYRMIKKIFAQRRVIRWVFMNTILSHDIHKHSQNMIKNDYISFDENEK